MVHEKKKNEECVARNRKETEQRAENSQQLAERTWKGKWISDGSYRLKSPASPVPMVFRKRFTVQQSLISLQIYATAMGIFDLWLDGRRVNNDYFSPGFTDYSAHLQYVCHDVKGLPAGDHEFLCIAAGGWAVGRTTHIDHTTKSRSKISAERQAVLADIVLLYADGSQEIIGTDESFEVTEEGPWRFGDFYDGEIYDAHVTLSDVKWRPASAETLCIHPRICARYGPPVTAHERFAPAAFMEAPSGN